MIPARNYRHARESGHPGRAGTAFAALGPRFAGATEKEEVGTICLVHTTSWSPVPPALSDRYIKSTDMSGLFFTSALFEARLARSTP
jgi:hypothetical protein